MKILPVLLVLGEFALASCGGSQNVKEGPHPLSETQGWETYLSMRKALEDSGEKIDYDTLIHLYTTMVQTQFEIPYMDRLLKSLIKKRNDNGRIDQMVLIFSASALGSSKYPVPDAYGIFESILTKNDRLTDWVISFVAKAIGNYVEDMPDGEKLVDLVEEKQANIISATGPKKESYGIHFLPPPKGEYIISYMAGIESQAVRESERRHYYYLIYAGYSEKDIETALRRLQINGIPDSERQSMPAMEYISRNQDQIPSQ